MGGAFARNGRTTGIVPAENRGLTGGPRGTNTPRFGGAFVVGACFTGKKGTGDTATAAVAYGSAYTFGRAEAEPEGAEGRFANRLGGGARLGGLGPSSTGGVVGCGNPTAGLLKAEGGVDGRG